MLTPVSRCADADQGSGTSIAKNYLFRCSQHILDLLNARQCDLDEVYARAGLANVRDVFPARMVTWDYYVRLLCHVDESGLIPGIGLMVGRETRLEHLGILGYATQSSKTFHEGLCLGVPYTRLMGWDIGTEYESFGPTGSELRVLYRHALPRAVYEQWSMVCLSGMRRLLSLSNTFVAGQLTLYFPYPAPAYLHLYRDSVGGATLHFDASRCACRYPAHWDQARLAGYDTSLHAFMLQQLSLQHKLQTLQPNILDNLNAFIYLHSDNGFPSMEAAAQYLNMSVSTLRRKLKSVNQTYESRVDAVRWEIAAHLLRNSSLKSEEVAYRLGYKHASNFYAAVKSRFGCSSKEYRRRLLAAAVSAPADTPR